MRPRPDGIRGRVTGEFNREVIQPPTATQPELVYRPIPYSDRAGQPGARPVWRLRFDLLTEPRTSFGLDINGEVIFGRGVDASDLFDLTPYDAEKLGVSRHHMMLRPTATKMFVLDLGSTNGTFRNDHSIGVNTPYTLNSGDVLSLGGLQFVVNIIDRPKTETGILRAKADLGDALTEMVKAITSQLDLDSALSQAVEAAMTLTSASETAVWLVDEETSELFLEAERGLEDEEIRRMRLPVTDSLAGRVIETGQSLRVNRDKSGMQVGENAPHWAESLIYVPITLGGVAFGVLAAAHRETSKRFDERDRRILETVADFAAIAVQNSRLFQATDRALAKRIDDLGAVNELSRAVSASLDPKKVYNVLTQQVQKHWQIDAATLWMLGEETSKIHLVSESRLKGARAKGASVRITLEIVHKVAQSGEPLLLSDMMELHGVTVGDTQEMRSELAVPVKLKNKVLGVLDLQSSQLSRFSQTDVLTLQTVVDQLAISIQNAQLYRQVHEYAEQLEQRVAQRTAELNAANEHLQALVRLREEFVANVSHELRTPITNLKLLQNVVGTAPSKKSERYLGAMQREVDRLDRTVNDLLRLSRMDQGQVALNPSPVNLNVLVQQFITDRTPMAESRGLKLSCELNPDLPTVMADEGLLGQALSILLTNALNYTPPGGWVEVRTQTRQSDGQHWIGFGVRDNGPGIAPKEQKLLFERFYRGKAGKESGTSGAGLGLAIVKEVVDLHSGQVEVISQGVPGEGATFNIWLHLTGIHKARLLLVDDNETTLEVIQEILTSHGYEVRASNTGEGALELLMAAESEGVLPEVIVADVVMPGMTGLELLKSVRDNTNWTNIPFLFISASTTLAMEGQIAGQRDVTFLRKPFDSETLQRTVTDVLETHRAQKK